MGQLNVVLSAFMGHAKIPRPAGRLSGRRFPFWRRELDIEDVAVIEAALRKLTLPTKGFADFANGEGRAAHDALQDQLHPAGIYGVPSFVFDGQIFVRARAFALCQLAP